MRKNNWVDVLNNNLQNFTKLRVVLYDNACFTLSNGLLLTPSESSSLIRKICNKKRSKTIETNFDNLYHKDENIRKTTIKNIRIENGRKAALKNIEKNGKSVAKGLLKFRKENPNFRSGFGVCGYNPWNKGLTKNDDKRIQRASLLMKTDFNPSKRLGISDNTRKKLSVKMKQNILTGKFTPNTNNRNKNFDCYYNGVKYRSSWEACFHSINPEYEYESLRIEYKDCLLNKRIYIVDFVCHNKKIAIEVKPDCMFDKKPELLVKEQSLINWCKENNYTYIRWNEYMFQKFKDKIDLTLLNESISRKIRGLIETFK